MLDTQQQILIEQRVTNQAKSTGASYLLWFFLGTFGVHRFYLGRPGTGFAMLALMLLGVLTFGITSLIVLVWWVVDLFLIPGMIAGDKDRLRARLTAEMLR
ncbi:TM2 domain-containing protein [Falsirhodobacter halotolerans]|uniref:TM2 domain-containing protein n=1 Tax=Falsirhodobacter halotolerans TaxID=1146892 RepID=UPI001FD46FA6|nr:TM2 domain-containing protein [Falsirhodobacter halotolerans]MCJ8140693.1 TM2 domain-containing protein [Falsirhodobacter halotolerans]